MAELKSTRHRGPSANISGQKFGRLLAVSWAGNSRWLCKCDCGGESTVTTANLKRGNTSSCGCIRKSKASKRATTHGLSNTIVYKTWVSVRRRCREKGNTSFPSYGGAGINVCDRWHDDLMAFVEDVGHPPSPAYTLDRIDNSKGYEPGNVRWATATEQARNRGVCRRISFQGMEFPSLSAFVEWLAPQIGANVSSLGRALSEGFRKKPRKVKASTDVDAQAPHSS